MTLDPPQPADGHNTGTGVSLTATEMKSDYVLVTKVLAQETISPSAATAVETEGERVVIEFPLGAVRDDAMENEHVQ